MMKSRSFGLYVCVSFAVHILVFGGMFLFKNLAPRTPPEPQTVDVAFLSPEELEKLTASERPTKKKVATLPSNQIVEQSDQSVNEEAVETRFLSAKNQKVQKQTLAKERGQFENLKKADGAKKGAKGDGRPKTLSQSDQREKLSRDLFKNFDASEALERQKVVDQGLQQGQGIEQGSGGVNGTADVAKSNDYLKDVDRGLETMLNTREFKYYSYYSRIRRQLAQHWEGKVREKLSRMFKEGRSPAAANQDRITKLMIVLNDQGTLVRVQVLSDSGVRDLDDAAIEAFRAAAPFPNPPKGIVESDGTVKIRWDFVLET